MYAVSSIAKPTPPKAKSVTVAGKTYYIVDGSNTALDTGAEACASVGLRCTGYTNLSSNTVCTAAHPGAKQLVSVNGSKNGFYCDGAPQTGLACAGYKNTCEVCPACNLNANCTTVITQQFREMFVSCGTALTASSSSKSSVRSSSSSSSVSSVATGKKCSFKQGTVAGGRILTTCNVKGAPDNFCIAAFGGLYPTARPVACAQNGEVVCNVPCSAAGMKNLVKCPLGAVAAIPSGSCPTSSSSSVSSKGRTVQLGGLCKTQADCIESNGNGGQNYVYCVGFSPNTRCSCSPNTQTTGGCQTNYANTTNQPKGAGCVHGGNCKSGVCVGPGPVYTCQ